MSVVNELDTRAVNKMNMEHMYNLEIKNDLFHISFRT
jgi:hypothetical protein